MRVHCGKSFLLLPFLVINAHHALRWIRWFRLRAVHLLCADRNLRTRKGDESSAYRYSISLAVGLLYIVNSLVRRPPDDNFTTTLLERISLVRPSSDPDDEEALAFNPFQRGMFFFSQFELSAAPRLWSNRSLSEAELGIAFRTTYDLIRKEFSLYTRRRHPGTERSDKPFPRNPNQHPDRPNLLTEEEKAEYNYAPPPDFGLDELDIRLAPLPEATVGDDFELGIRDPERSAVEEESVANKVAHIIGLFTEGIFDRTPNNRETSAAHCCLTVEELHQLDWEKAFLTLDLRTTFSEVYAREYNESS